MKTGPLRTGAAALHYWEARQAAVSNNLANASTPGFKAERVFARLLDDARVQADGRADLTSGTLTPTGRPLDVALEGDGFLVVRTDRGLRWTRGGSLSLNAEGVLVDGGGRPVMGAGGPILLPPGEVKILADGTIRVDDAEVGSLRIERGRNGGPVEREGANLWVPPGKTEAVEPGSVRVHQGHIEESNVDPVEALVEMIEIQRAYQAVQRSMQAADEVMGTITNDIGRVSG